MSIPSRGSIRRDFWNLPNAITLVRIAIIPLVLIFVADDRPLENFIGSMLFTFAAVTDVLDGYLARRQNLVTLTGKLLDPLADKLIVMSTLVMLLSMGRVPAWVVIVIVARELAVTGLRSIASGEGVVIAAGEGGKTKTALQLVGVICLIVHYPYRIDLLVWQGMVEFHHVGLWVIYLSLFFSLLSAVEYVRLFVTAVEARSRPKP